MFIFHFFSTGDRQWELWRCLPGQALRDWRNGGHQESVAGQAFQEPRTADNETLGALQHCQGQSILSFFTPESRFHEICGCFVLLCQTKLKWFMVQDQFLPAAQQYGQGMGKNFRWRRFRQLDFDQQS